jgi:predicted O-linked N-acetylglucosamine transferase (SPINDLY family)
MVTQTLAEYEAKALELAHNPEKIKALKDKLGKANARLFDVVRFTRDLEAAYAVMSERRGAPPQSFSV